MRGARVLVTGASGFIGQRLCQVLASGGASVRAVVRAPWRGRALRGAGVEVRTAALRPGSRLSRLVSERDVVFHLAHDFGAGIQANVGMAEALADLCETAAAPPRMVYVSSAAVYDDWPGSPVSEESPSSLSGGSPYKQAKRAVELMLESRGGEGSLAAVSIQPTIVYGPGGWMWVEKLARRLLRGEVVLPSTPGVCDLVYVDDVVDALVRAAVSGRAGGRYLVSGPDRVTWHEYYESLASALDADSIRYEDMRPEAPGPRARPPKPDQHGASVPGERLRALLVGAVGGAGARRIRAGMERLVGSRGGVWSPAPSEVPMYASTGGASIDRARRELGYNPAVDLAEGMRRMSQYLSVLRRRHGS